MQNIFFDIGLIIIIAAVLAGVAKLLRQPLIPAYIIAGILLGPVFGLITEVETITLLAEIGIAFLLFIVGLEIDFKKLRSVAFVSSVGGLIKTLILFGLGFLVAVLFGLLPLQAVYVGLILSFSSTMVVLKLLSDRRELDSLHGRIVIGTLLLEDLIAIFALTVLTTIEGFSSVVLLMALAEGAGLLVAALLLGKYVFPKLFRWAAGSQEALFLFSLTVMFAFSLAFYAFGFSIAIGAFVAGIALGNLVYSTEIIVRVRPLRDFFATIFFVALGMEIVLAALSSTLWLIVVLSFIAIVGKPLLVMTITSLFGYKKRPAFMSAALLGQISEFGLIVAALGLSLGHIGEDLFSVAVVVALLSITATSYLVKFETWLFRKTRTLWTGFEHLNLREHQLGYLPSRKAKYDVILAGHNRIGYSIVKRMQHKKKKLLVVDFNPEVIASMAEKQFPCLYGDVSDPDVVDLMNLKNAKLLISTIPDLHANVILLRKAKKASSKINVFVTAAHVRDALHLYERGADYVIMPHFLGGEHVSHMIRGMKLSVRKILQNKMFHIQELKHRKEIGHDHPLPM